MSAITKTRRSVSARLRGVTLPDCFAQATVSAAANAYSRETVSAKAARRRLSDKAMTLAARAGAK